MVHLLPFPVLPRLAPSAGSTYRRPKEPSEAGLVLSAQISASVFSKSPIGNTQPTHSSQRPNFFLLKTSLRKGSYMLVHMELSMVNNSSMDFFFQSHQLFMRILCSKGGRTFRVMREDWGISDWSVNQGPHHASSLKQGRAMLSLADVDWSGWLLRSAILGLLKGESARCDK